MTATIERETVTRETLPTGSFTLTNSLIAWIAAEAKRRGIKKSHLVKEILEAARAQNERRAA